MKKITLIGGFKDARGVVHREVEVGYVLRGADLFAIDATPQAASQTAREFLILTKAITKFGTLKTPVSYATLVMLDSIDRDDLLTAYNELEFESRGGHKPKVLADDKLQLTGGYEFGGVKFDVVEFGARLTGKDFIEADQLELSGARRACFLAGRQVKRLAQSDGAGGLPGALDLEAFDKFSVADIYGIQGAAELWRQTFRRPREGAKKQPDVKDGLPAGEGDGLE